MEQLSEIVVLVELFKLSVNFVAEMTLYLTVQHKTNTFV